MTERKNRKCFLKKEIKETISSEVKK